MDPIRHVDSAEARGAPSRVGASLADWLYPRQAGEEQMRRRGAAARRTIATAWTPYGGFPQIGNSSWLAGYQFVTIPRESTPPENTVKLPYGHAGGVVQYAYIDLATKRAYRFAGRSTWDKLKRQLPQAGAVLAAVAAGAGAAVALGAGGVAAGAGAGTATAGGVTGTTAAATGGAATFVAGPVGVTAAAPIGAVSAGTIATGTGAAGLGITSALKAAGASVIATLTGTGATAIAPSSQRPDTAARQAGPGGISGSGLLVASAIGIGLLALLAFRR